MWEQKQEELKAAEETQGDRRSGGGAPGMDQRLLSAGGEIMKSKGREINRGKSLCTNHKHHPQPSSTTCDRERSWN